MLITYGKRLSGTIFELNRQNRCFGLTAISMFASHVALAEISPFSPSPDRTFIVPADDRTFIVEADDRTFIVPEDDRTLIIKR